MTIVKHKRQAFDKTLDQAQAVDDTQGCGQDFARLFLRGMDPATEKALQSFAQRLIELRAAKAWTQEDLASEAGIKWHTIYAYERGLREPKMLAVKRLARALGITMDEMLRGIGDEPPPARQHRKRAA